MGDRACNALDRSYVDWSKILVKEMYYGWNTKENKKGFKNRENQKARELQEVSMREGIRSC